MEDENLINGLKSGDEKVFRAFVDAYHEKIFNVCMGFVNNSSDADDLAQEVFIEVYRSVAHFKGKASLSTWLYRIAVNKSLNYLNKRKRQHRFSFFLNSGNDNESLQNQVEESHESKLITIERNRLIYRLIDQLPDNQRIAFTLHKIEELSQNEVAEIMDISQPAIESLIHRAKANLQKKLISALKKN